MYVSGASPIVQCEWNSSGLPPSAALITGISVRARSGVSKPAGSFRYARSTSGQAAMREASAA